MTYLDAMRRLHPALRGSEVIEHHCPAEYFGTCKYPCKTYGGQLSAVEMTQEAMNRCKKCWEQEMPENTFANYPTEFCRKISQRTDSYIISQIEGAMQHEPLSKKKLAAKVAIAILESEAFNESYPRTTDPEEIKKRLTRMLEANRVSAEDGKRMLQELAESYQGSRYQ